MKIMPLNENASLLINAKGVMTGLHDNSKPCNTDAHIVTTLWEGNKLKNTEITSGQEDNNTTSGWKMTNKYKSATAAEHWRPWRFGTRKSWSKGKDGLKRSEATTTTTPALARLDWLWPEEPRVGLNSICCRWAVVITWDEREVLRRDRCSRLRWGCLTGRWSTCCAHLCGLCCGMFTSSYLVQLA